MLHARPADAVFLHQIHGELHIHGGLGPLHQQLAVTVARMSVAEHEVSAWLVYRQVYDRALVHGVVIHVAAVRAHRAGIYRLLIRRGHADAAERRMRWKFEPDALA